MRRLHTPGRALRVAFPILAGVLLPLWGCGEPPEVGLPAADAQLEPGPGLSGPIRWAIDASLDVSARLGMHSGYVAMFARRGRVVHAKASGYADLEAARPMTLETRFRIASMTKPVIAVAALVLIEDGRLALDDPVARHLPAAGALRVAASTERNRAGEIPTLPLARPLTVRHLLTFTAGMGSDEDDSDLGRMWKVQDVYLGAGSLGDRVNRLLTLPLYEQPGERWRYGWAWDVLARVVEVASGEPLDRFLETRIFGPLGMSSTGYLPPGSERARLATIYTQDEQRNLVRVEAPKGDALGWTPGGSGLVSTAGDFMRFALMLWNGGSYDGARILSRESVALMTRPHVRSTATATSGGRATSAPTSSSARRRTWSALCSARTSRARTAGFPTPSTWRPPSPSSAASAGSLELSGTSALASRGTRPRPRRAPGSSSTRAAGRSRAPGRPGGRRRRRCR
jgi:CubicO group peptidase (beta-lactamase class C family)